MGIVLMAALCTDASAREVETSAEVSLSTTAVAGPINVDPSRVIFNPSLRFGLGITGGLALSDGLALSIRWQAWRDQRLCDTCDDNWRPGDGGSAGAAFRSSDVVIAARGAVAEVGETRLSASASATVPSSRQSVLCNPMYGALGIGASSSTPVGKASTSLSLGGTRSVYRHAAAPVGACATHLTEGATTATGVVFPEVGEGRYAGLPNTAWALQFGTALVDPLSWLGVGSTVGSSVTASLNAQSHVSADGDTVATATGPVVVDRARAPLVFYVPVSLGVSYGLTDSVDLDLTAANTVPGVLSDASAHFRALPARTSYTLAATGRW